MIEGRVTLERPTAYFTDETIRCSVRFINLGTERDTVRWATAQLVCQAALHNRYVRTLKSEEFNINGFSEPKHVKSTSESATSLQLPPTPHVRGGQALTVYSLPVTILVCDLELEPNQSEIVTYSAVIPAEAPSSHRGMAAKFSHLLVVNAQRNNEPTQAVTLPVKIVQFSATWRTPSLLLPTSSVTCYDTESGCSSAEAKFSQISSSQCTRPGKEKPQALYNTKAVKDMSKIDKEAFFQQAIEDAKYRVEQLELAAQDDEVRDDGEIHLDAYATAGEKDKALVQAMVQRLGDLTLKQHGPNRQRTYRIGSQDASVCLFVLDKLTYRLGENVTGQFDFIGCNLACHQVAVRLESVEVVQADYCVEGSAEPVIRPKVHSEFSEYCRFVSRTYLSLHIPVAATAEFSTDWVSVQWQLRFDFITEHSPFTPPDNADEERETSEETDNEHTPIDLPSTGEDIVSSAPESVSVQPLTWILPISVLPTSPINLPRSNHQAALRL